MSRLNRRKWGAVRATGGPYPLDPAQVDGIALHWPAMRDQLVTVAAVSAALRSWQRLHMVTNGWSDIAYQEAVDQLGNVYSLRGLRHRSAANGSTDVNLRYGALLLVLAPGEQPSQAMIATVRRRIRRHRALFPASRAIVGHQQVRPEPTACPGPAVMALIRAGVFDPDRPARPS